MDRQGSGHHVLERLLLDISAKPTDLPLSLLQDITNCFSDDQEIGSGGFAVVYKGVVGNGRMVAVKKLSTSALMDENKFHKEVECLMKAKHKNIVRFLGYCADTQGKVADYEGKFVMADLRNWLLCFDYVPNGSLDKYITDASHGLEWKERYQMIKGICDGLNYLHKKRILHLDLKPANILVDDHMVPKITDFGLSRIFDEKQTRAFTSHLFGSQGYLALEFYRGEISFASDIYSLGVIITEILTGEKGYPEVENVVESWMNRLEELEGGTQLEQVRVCTMIGIECMNMDPKKRPVASDIINRLEKTNGTDCCAETGMSSSAVEHVNLLKEQTQEKTGKLAAEHLREELQRTEVVAEFSQVHREDHRQEEADQWSLRGSQVMKEKDRQQVASISSSNATVFDKLNNLDIFGQKAYTNYVKYGGPILAKSSFVKIFEKRKLEPILKPTNLVGKDSFGAGYKGLLDNALVVIKKLNGGDALESEQFANEVIKQCHINHMNIVRLIGCCVEVDAPILVYEFVSRGRSLDDILHGSNKLVPLNLNLRLKIATGSASGLDFMHLHDRFEIIHGNIKPANILLDDKFVPKISDYGVSRLIARDKEHVTTVIGDMSYMDPVYLQTGLMTEKSDVYSFGVLILELISRKKATRSDNNSLVRNFLEHHKKGKKATELFDKEITATTEELELLDILAGIAVECLNLDVDERPSISEVAESLSMLNRTRK